MVNGKGRGEIVFDVVQGRGDFQCVFGKHGLSAAVRRERFRFMLYAVQFDIECQQQASYAELVSRFLFFHFLDDLQSQIMHFRVNIFAQYVFISLESGDGEVIIVPGTGEKVAEHPFRVEE